MVPGRHQKSGIQPVAGLDASRRQHER